MKIWRSGPPLKYSGTAWVPQHGPFYQLPVQKSAWFGNNNMELALSEAGRITKLKDGTGGAGAGALKQPHEVAAVAVGPVHHRGNGYVWVIRGVSHASDLAKFALLYASRELAKLQMATTNVSMPDAGREWIDAQIAAANTRMRATISET